VERPAHLGDLAGDVRAQPLPGEQAEVRPANQAEECAARVEDGPPDRLRAVGRM
jgi:hypothetical protein